MWKPLQKGPPFFITISEGSEKLLINITDYQKCWKCDLCRKSLLHSLKESNDGLEFDDDNELMERGIDMLHKPESLKKVIISHVDNDLKVIITKQFEITLRLELRFVESSSEHFFQMVTQPLLKTLCDLRSSQHELRQALLKKDREIEEYKIEGRAPRRLITTIYNDVAHMNKYKAFEECFGSEDAEISALLKITIDSKRNNLPTQASSTNRIQENTDVEKPSADTLNNINQNTSVPKFEDVKVKTEKLTEELNIPKIETLPSPRKRQRNKLNL